MAFFLSDKFGLFALPPLVLHQNHSEKLLHLKYLMITYFFILCLQTTRHMQIQ